MKRRTLNREEGRKKYEVRRRTIKKRRGKEIKGKKQEKNIKRGENRNK